MPVCSKVLQYCHIATAAPLKLPVKIITHGYSISSHMAHACFDVL